MKLGLMEMIRRDKHLLGLPNLLSFSRLLFLPLVCYDLLYLIRIHTTNINHGYEPQG